MMRRSTIRVGDPLEKHTMSGDQFEGATRRARRLGVAEGADLYQPACDLPGSGVFRPTLFTNVAHSYRIAREEISREPGLGAPMFGPRPGR